MVTYTRNAVAYRREVILSSSDPGGREETGGAGNMDTVPTGSDLIKSEINFGLCNSPFVK